MLGRHETASASVRVKIGIIRLAGVAGTAGPVLFGGVVLALSVIEYDFMREIGWQPVTDPAGAWPSGLALGPYGAVQIANFLISGFLLCLFALGLYLRTATGSASTTPGFALLFVAGVAMALMGFRTDPIERVGPRSLHGLIHDSAYVVFVLAFLAALFFLWWGLRRDTRWRGHARYTLATGILSVLLLLLPGVAYYVFLVTLLAWIEATAVRLWQPL
jgi:hypothetical protein